MLRREREASRQLFPYQGATAMTTPVGDERRYCGSRLAGVDAARAGDPGATQRVAISAAPQSTQNGDWRRRAAACLLSSQREDVICAFTTPPHLGQWLTGALLRR